MGWERREATLEREGGNGAGVRAGGSGLGRAGGAPPHSPHSHTAGKGAPSPRIGPGGWAPMLHPRERQENGQFHLPAPPRTPTAVRARAGGQVPQPRLGPGGGKCLSLSPSRGAVGTPVPGDRRRSPPGSGRAMGRAEARPEAGGCLVACSSCVQHTHARTNTAFYLSTYISKNHSTHPARPLFHTAGAGFYYFHC